MLLLVSPILISVEVIERIFVVPSFQSKMHDRVLINSCSPEIAFQCRVPSISPLLVWAVWRAGADGGGGGTWNSVKKSCFFVGYLNDCTERSLDLTWL